MAKPEFNVALSDSLQLEYCRYKQGKEFNRYLINRILRYSEGAIITNVGQLERIGPDAESELKSFGTMLRKSNLKKQSLEELADKTNYNIILSDKRDDFPYVNITAANEPLQPVIGGCFFRDRPRDKAVSHITKLCAKASSILVYDAYLNRDERNIGTLATLLPDKKLELVYHPDHLTPDTQTELLRLRPKLTLQPQQLPTHHDRYIVVDGTIEIVLTSGFCYLASHIKEITYIIRRCTTSRFI